MEQWARNALLAGAAGIALAIACAAGAQAAISLPPGFQLRTALSGLEQPTSVRFASNGLVFVAEKRGTIQVFDGLQDPAPTEVVNLRREVFNDGDRGLLGLAVDPDFTQGKPYVYALYTRNVALSAPATVPRWGSAGGGDPGTTDVDACATLYDQTTGCEVSGRLVRIAVDPATGAAAGAPQTLLSGWCQQFSTHSVGDLAFGAGRVLYVSGGEGAGYDSWDAGQFGNPCGDPPGQGGALRAQDLLTPFPSDATGLSGAVLRIDPDTGAAAPGNPLQGGSDPSGNEQRIIASGLRNPYRMTLRPGAGTDDLFVGDVGWANWEEIDRLTAPFGAQAANFGWPCYEGDWSGDSAPNYTYEQNVPATCNQSRLSYADVRPPFFAYFHTQREGACYPSQLLDDYNPPATIVSSSAITGLAFYDTGDYPDEYDGGLFFGDYSRGCLWFMGASGGVPDRSSVQQFASWDASNPYSPEVGLVGLERGPGGDIFFADIANGAVRRLRYGAGAVVGASATRGASPLPVTFSAGGSTAPPGETITGYDWDFDGDGTTDSQTAGPSASHTYASKGLYRARVSIGYSNGDRDASDELQIQVDPPKTVQIDAPASGRWSVGDKIAFTGAAEVGDTGDPITAAGLSWSLVVRHCGDGGDCHSHQADSQLSDLGPGNTGPAGIFTGPDHEFPSHVELRLTARDPGMPELTTSTTLRLDPQTVQLGVNSEPAGRTLTVNTVTAPAPFTREVIRGSLATVGAALTESEGTGTFLFAGWSDGGAASHTLTPLADQTLTARYSVTSPAPVVNAPPSLAEASPTPAAAPRGGRRATAVYRRGRSVRASGRGTVALRVRCPGPRDCSARVRLFAQPRRGARSIRVASRRVVRLRAGSTSTVRLRLGPETRKRLAIMRSTVARTIITVRTSKTRTHTTRTRFMLLAPRRAKR